MLPCLSNACNTRSKLICSDHALCRTGFTANYKRLGPTLWTHSPLSMRFSQVRISWILALITAACFYVSLVLTPDTGAPRRRTREYNVRSQPKQASAVSSRQTRERHTSDLPGGVSPDCSDRNQTCRSWAKSGECLSNPVFVLEACTASCGVCLQGSPAQDRVSLGIAAPAYYVARLRVLDYPHMCS